MILLERERRKLIREKVQLTVAQFSLGLPPFSATSRKKNARVTTDFGKLALFLSPGMSIEQRDHKINWRVIRWKTSTNYLKGITSMKYFNKSLKIKRWKIRSTNYLKKSPQNRPLKLLFIIFWKNLLRRIQKAGFWPRFYRVITYHDHHQEDQE